jgi:hypothetical protein
MSSQEHAKFIEEWHNRALKAKEEAHRILATHEQAGSSRVIVLEDLLRELSGLPVDVEDYFREAVICVEQNLLRAAVVLSWSGFFHVLAERLYTEKEKELRNLRSKWQFSGLKELKSNYPEYQILDVANELNIISNSKLREHKGQLSKRNQCAHPTLYKPSLNVAVGFVDDMLRQSKNHL